MANATMDMTLGRPGKQITRFMIPVLVTNLLQQLYVLVDTMIVGRGVGLEALAAVGATDMLRSIALWGILGLTDGFGIVLTILYGAKDMKQLPHYLRVSYLLCIPIGMVFAFIGITLSGPLLSLIHCPAEIYREAVRYLMITYVGTITILLYNTGASVLRAFGDSRTPLYGMLLSSILNVGLDLLLVYGFRFGVSGAAIATVAAQLISGLYCFMYVQKLPIKTYSWHPEAGDAQLAVNLLKKGLPMAFQHSFIAIGGAIFQTIINGYGVVFLAGYTSMTKLYLLIEGAALALKTTLTTFVGQNEGAHRYDRIQKGLRFSFLLSAIISIVLGVTLFFTGQALIHLFISADPALEQAVLDVGFHFLLYMCPLLYTLYLLDVYRGTVSGFGNTLSPMFSGIAELFGRLLVGTIGTGLWGVDALYLAEPAAWIFADAVVIPTHYILLYRRKNRNRNYSKST